MASQAPDTGFGNTYCTTMNTLVLTVLLCAVMASALPKFERGGSGGKRKFIKLCRELAQTMQVSKRATISDDLVVRFCQDILVEIGEWTRPPPPPTTAASVTGGMTGTVTGSMTTGAVTGGVTGAVTGGVTTGAVTGGATGAVTGGVTTGAVTGGVTVSVPVTGGGSTMRKRSLGTGKPGPTTGGMTTQTAPSTTEDRCASKGSPLAMMTEICREISESELCMSRTAHLDLYTSLKDMCDALVLELKSRLEK